MSKDYYKILGVNKNASEEEIKKAYRSKAMETHPDKGGNESEFKEVAEAYEVLSDTQKKSRYDQFGDAGPNLGNQDFQGGFDFGGVEDLFSKFGFGDIFGSSRGGQRNYRGNDLRIRVSLTLHDIIYGLKKTVKYNRNIKCNVCDGKGGKDISTCGDCGGTGQRVIVQRTPFGQIRQSVMCTTCGGKGTVIKNTCSSCSGKGINIKEETVEMDIPKGSTSGINLEMPQYGNWGPAGYGNLQIEIEEISDPKFKREDINLVCEEQISIADAILGKDTTIDTPHGKIRYTVMPGTQHGKVIKIGGRGIPDINFKNSGDLLIKISIKIPTNITLEERQLVNQLKTKQNFK